MPNDDLSRPGEIRWRTDTSEYEAMAQRERELLLANLRDQYWTEPSLSRITPSDSAPQIERVIITREDYVACGMYTGRNHPDNRQFIIVDEPIARRYGVQTWPVDTDISTLPQPIMCEVCGRVIYGDPAVANPRTCESCATRVRATRRAIANGGRRFGIEIEFSLPSSYADDDLDEYYDDPTDGCGCEECRAERERLLERSEASGRRPRPTSMESIATVLSDAGVPCVAPGYTHQVYPDTWKLVTDGSLAYGYELVSPPLQWRQADQVRVACETLQSLGMRATRDCGLHVHHDVGDMTVARARVLAKNWSAMIDQSNCLVGDGRHYSEWCYPPSELVVQQQAEFSGTSLRQFLDIDYERYHPLNWTCWHSYGTVEIRLHESTLDPEEILAWVAYGQSIVEASMAETELVPPDDIDHALEQLTIRRAAGPNRVRAALKRKALTAAPARRRRLR